MGCLELTRIKWRLIVLRYPRKVRNFHRLAEQVAFQSLLLVVRVRGLCVANLPGSLLLR